MLTITRTGEDKFTVDDVSTKAKVEDFDIPLGGYGVFSGDKHQVEIHRLEQNSVSIVYIPHDNVIVDKPETEFVCPPGTVIRIYLSKGVLGMTESQASIRLFLKRDHSQVKTNGDRPYLFNAGIQGGTSVRFKLPGRAEHKGITYDFEKVAGKDKMKLTVSGKPQ